MHDYQPYEGEEPGVVLKDPPAKDFQTIALQETTQNQQNGYQQAQFEETNFANFEGASFQNQQSAEATAAGGQPSAASNPFKSQAPNNPFRK